MRTQDEMKNTRSRGKTLGVAPLVRATSLTTAELRHMHYNFVCDVKNRTVFIMSSQWMV